MSDSLANVGRGTRPGPGQASDDDDGRGVRNLGADGERRRNFHGHCRRARHRADGHSPREVVVVVIFAIVIAAVVAVACPAAVVDASTFTEVDLSEEAEKKRIANAQRACPKLFHRHHALCSFISSSAIPPPRIPKCRVRSFPPSTSTERLSSSPVARIRRRPTETSRLA